LILFIIFFFGIIQPYFLPNYYLSLDILLFIRIMSVYRELTSSSKDVFRVRCILRLGLEYLLVFSLTIFEAFICLCPCFLLFTRKIISD